MKKPIQAGDFFLLPFKGKRRDLLVKAIQPHEVSDHWYACNEAGHTSLHLLSSCRRCPPSLAHRLTKAKRRP